MAKGKIKGSNIDPDDIDALVKEFNRQYKAYSMGEPKVQSKINSALSYGRVTGETYVNKGAAKPKKYKTAVKKNGPR